ncbi:MAG: hypothetical protein JWR19_96 [Pedosphaera sp.]|nr:hypothetical protein [Pedosphaera sp.]
MTVVECLIASKFSEVRKFFNQSKFGKAASAALLACLVLFISTLAASSSLHKFIHADAGDSDHHCVITLFQQGQVNSVVGMPILAGIITLFGGIALLAETFLLTSTDYRFSPSRAPPFRRC